MGEVIRRITQEQKDIVNSIPAEFRPTTQEDYATAEQLAAQTPIKTESSVDFNLRCQEDVKKIKKSLKDAEEEKRAEENMKTWRMQLSTIDSKAEQIMIAMEFEIDILIEALKRNVEEVDDTYLMFCKKEDRKPMHSDAINKIMEDMKSEHEEIVPYIERSKKYETKMM